MRQNSSLFHRNSSRNLHRLLLFTALLVILSGCGRHDGIRRYTVPKESTTRRAAPATPADMTQDRMLAAIVPHGKQTWFFKLSGPDEAVAAQSEAFQGLIQSIRLPKGGGPAWTLPEGWKQQPGSGMRYATIQIDSTGGPLELTVIPLPTPKINADEAALANVNRWRKQLGLPSVSSDAMTEKSSDEMRRVELSGGTKVISVNLLGNLSAGGGGMRPPFAGNGNSR